jgi:DNA repair ATPase RecN
VFCYTGFAMLTQLTINNFAIVRHLILDLNEGMSVITGETGAGKSIAIDALGLCLGYRSESSMIRNGSNKADITATFLMQPNSPAYLWYSHRRYSESYLLLRGDIPYPGKRREKMPCCN